MTKRVRSRSSRVGMASGGRSELSTIWRLDWWRWLKVWKNSSWVSFLPSKNWMSSTSSTSMSRNRRLKDSLVPWRIESTNSERNCSEVT